MKRSSKITVSLFLVASLFTASVLGNWQLQWLYERLPSRETVSRYLPYTLAALLGLGVAGSRGYAYYQHQKKRKFEEEQLQAKSNQLQQHRKAYLERILWDLEALEKEYSKDALNQIPNFYNIDRAYRQSDNGELGVEGASFDRVKSQVQEARTSMIDDLNFISKQGTKDLNFIDLVKIYLESLNDILKKRVAIDNMPDDTWYLSSTILKVLGKASELLNALSKKGQDVRQYKEQINLLQNEKAKEITNLSVNTNNLKNILYEAQELLKSLNELLKVDNE